MVLTRLWQRDEFSCSQEILLPVFIRCKCSTQNFRPSLQFKFIFFLPSLNTITYIFQTHLWFIHHWDIILPAVKTRFWALLLTTAHYKHSLVHHCFQLFEVSYSHITELQSFTGLQSLPPHAHYATALSWQEARQKLQRVPERTLEAADSLPEELWLEFLLYTGLTKSFGWGQTFSENNIWLNSSAMTRNK